jgi:outer membrane protein assembly factor BamE (lipoprotein component of BamABCDE complex)
MGIPRLTDTFSITLFFFIFSSANSVKVNIITYFCIAKIIDENIAL